MAGDGSDFFGGAYEDATFSSDLNLREGLARVYVLTPTGAGRTVNLPDARTIRTGAPVFYVINLGVDSFDVDDSAAGNVGSLAQDKLGLLMLVDNSTAAGVWRMAVRDVSGTVGNPGTTFLTIMGGRNMDDTARYYNHKTSAWVAGVATAANDHSEGAACELATRGYVSGGDSSAEFDKLDEYDPDVWTAKTDNPQDNRHHAGAGGSGSLGWFTGNSFTASDRKVDEYDRSGDTWTARTGFPSYDRYHHTSQCDSADDVYTCGGNENSAQGVNVWGSDKNSKYDTVGDSHSELTAVPSPEMGGHGGAFESDLYYVTCGDSESPSGLKDDTRAYDVSGDSWAAKTDFTGTDKRRLGFVTIVDDGDIYASAGEVGAGAGDLLDETHKFDPSAAGGSGTWSAETDVDITTGENGVQTAGLDQ